MKKEKMCANKPHGTQSCLQNKDECNDASNKTDKKGKTFFCPSVDLERKMKACGRAGEKKALGKTKHKR